MLDDLNRLFNGLELHYIRSVVIGKVVQPIIVATHLGDQKFSDRIQLLQMRIIVKSGRSEFSRMSLVVGGVHGGWRLIVVGVLIL